jgi:hypothetical protein
MMIDSVCELVFVPEVRPAGLPARAFRVVSAPVRMPLEVYRRLR